MISKNTCCQKAGPRTIEGVKQKELPAGSFKEYKMIYMGGSFSPLNMRELWKKYNSDPALAQKVDNMLEATMKKQGWKFYRSVDPLDKLKIWVCEPKSYAKDTALAVDWEMRHCGYCGKDEPCHGHVICQGIYPHACDSCKTLRKQAKFDDPDGTKQNDFEETMAELDSDHARDMGVELI